MVKALLAAATVVSATALAQSAPEQKPAQPTTPPAASKPAGQQPAPAAETAKELEEVREEVDTKLENAKKEMREEIRAQLATQSIAQGWEEEWVEEKRKLELFEIDGYLRVRPDLFNNFDLGRIGTGNQQLFPEAAGSNERTLAGANMRLRFEPTLNVSEEVRVRMQVDALDNVVLGSSPDYAASRLGRTGYSIFSETQWTPRSAINAMQDSISVKRAYGEVSTPLGILRFGRMGSQWGLGVLHNDGNCLDCDFGETVDRIQFVTEPLAGYYVIPMFDFNAEGPIGSRTVAPGEQGQPYDIDNSDDAHSWVLAVARRDTPQQEKARLDNDLAVFNYGLHFTWRTQRRDFVPQTSLLEERVAWVDRDATLYIPDFWVKYERKNFRLEAEFIGVLGTIGNSALTKDTETNPDSGLDVLQYGAVVQGELRVLDNALKLQAEVGVASGDPAPGMGNFPGRVLNANPDQNAPNPGDIDGQQFECGALGCSDDDIRNFVFSRDYRVDQILFREILGGITDTLYVKPGLTYTVADGFDLYGSAIYSRAMFKASTPSTTSADLGLELDVGARYQTDDGFYAQLTWGVLFPLAGLNDFRATTQELDTAMSLRGIIGVKF